MTWIRILAAAAAIALCTAQLSAAQPQPEAQPQPDAQPQPEAQQGTAPEPQGEPGAQSQPIEGTPLTTTDVSPESEEPTPPNTLDTGELQATRRAEITMGAGEGSDVAYASATVVELGGTFGFTHQSETTTFRIAPSVGYFVADNLELTLFPDVTVISVEDETDVTFGAMLEPSYHVPFSDDIFGFAGVGIGVRYAEDPGADFALRPRLGLDVMVGRSGIFKPAAFLDIGANDGLTQGGVEAGFTVML